MEKKNTLKIKYVDYWDNHHIEDDMTYIWMNEYYNVVFSDEPDYIFYSCFGYDHLNYDCLRIFYSGENYAPNFNECDYALTCEEILLGDRHIIFPNFFKYKKEIDLIDKMEVNPKGKEYAERKFCAYVVSNGNADPIRERIFDAMSEYKQVDSGGRFRNNVGGPVEDKLMFQSQYKFVIAFENSSHKGYTTEKILQAFASGCVPIYWGDPDVYRYFNKDAFINLSEFHSVDEMVDYIRYVDGNDDLYLKILNQAKWSDNKLYDEKMIEFDNFMRNIFLQPIEYAFRRNRSAMSMHYENM